MHNVLKSDNLVMLEWNYKSQLDDAQVRDSHHNKRSVLQLGLNNQKHEREKRILSSQTGEDY